MGTGAQASPGPKLIFPWEQQGMYKPRGKKVIYYPNYPDRVTGRTVHAEVKDNAEADSLAQALNRQTRDICREFQTNPSIAPEQLQSEFANLQEQIDAKADAYISSVKKATADFYALIPLLDKMQAMLSQRGKLRELMDTATLPTWTEWFDNFRPRLKEKMTIRSIQRKLREYRGGSKPTPTKRTSHIDQELLGRVTGVTAGAHGLAGWIVAESEKPKGKGLAVPPHWLDRAKDLRKDEMLFRDLIGRQNDPFGVRLPAGEILVVGKRKYRVADGLTPQRVTPTKTKGVYRITLLVRAAELVTRKLRKREECPECSYTIDVRDGRFSKHTNYKRPSSYHGMECAMSDQPVVLDERGKVINTAEKARGTTV